MNKLDNCPKCNASFIGGPIPPEFIHHYSPPHFYRREIGIDGGFIGVYDGIVAYRCPDCGHEFPRPDISESLSLEFFNKYKKVTAK